jgi:SM-20-related protein
VLDLQRIAQTKMETDPYRWAFIDQLFSADDARLLAASFPRDKFKKVAGFDGEKGYEYMSRSMIHMGAEIPSNPGGLSPAWRELADDLLSFAYRSALEQISGQDLASAQMEVNIVSYGPGAWLGPHLDLKEKMMTHVLYFNNAWNHQDGGCLNILRSSDPSDAVAQVLPVVGHSALLVRSNQSWHSVSRVTPDCRTPRRSINVIFHLAGSASTMWPPGEDPLLQDCAPAY